MTISEAADLLRAQDNLLLLTHVRPDGDTMGSASALCHALRQAGKTAYLYNNPQFCDNDPWIAAPYLAPADFQPSFVVAVDMLFVLQAQQLTDCLVEGRVRADDGREFREGQTVDDSRGELADHVSFFCAFLFQNAKQADTQSYPHAK